MGCYCMPQLLYILKCSYKLGYVLQIRAEVTTEWCCYYNLGQNSLQVRAFITNWGISTNFNVKLPTDL